MSQHEKLAAAFKACAGPYPYRDLQRLLTALGYVESSGKGSARRFYNSALDHLILLHEPHPGNTIHLYMVRQIRTKLEDKGLL